MTNTTTLPQPQPSNSSFLKIFESKVFWLLVVVILFSIPLVMSLKRPSIVQLPVLGQLENFELINQKGRNFGTKDIAGSVLLVNFIFTRCPDTCPMLTRTMAQIQSQLKATGKSIQLLSITADPAFDKPEVLDAYASKFGADPGLWTFLTGSREAVRKVVVDNFKTALESPISADSQDMAPAFEIAHSERFVLIDQIGRIRAYKTIKTEKDINQTVKDFAILVNTPPR